MEKTVTTAAGQVKRIIAPNQVDLVAAVNTAKAEVVPKTLNINDKTQGNKHYSELS